MKLPALFISHGAPTLALAESTFSRAWQTLGAALERPQAILMVSAHWDTAVPSVSTAERLETIHDFAGFPAALHEMRYEPRGAPALAGRAGELLEAAGHAPRSDPQRGIDHGGWVPLRWMVPQADIPVTQLSIQSRRGARHHHEVGLALAPLLDEGVLIIGSGGIVHNLHELDWRESPATVPAWATAFNDWIADRVQARAQGDLVEHRRLAPHSARAHPTEEHLVPFFVALGAGGLPARRLDLGFDLGSLGMDCYAFG